MSAVHATCDVTVAMHLPRQFQHRAKCIAFLLISIWVCCRAVAKLAESPEFHLSKTLEPGDIEIVHNPTIFHTRGEVSDGQVSPTVIDSALCTHTFGTFAPSMPVSCACKAMAA